MNRKEQESKLIQSIEKRFKDERSKTLAYMTAIGSGAHVSEYLMRIFIEEDRIKEMPNTIKYACALISSHLMTIINPDQAETIRVDLSDESFEMNEQTEEVIYRKMKRVVEHLYHWIQENEKT